MANVSEAIWEEVQKKTFQGWVNMHLAERQMKVSSLSTDLSDGVKLINLLEVLNKKPIEGRYYKNPKSRPYKIDNINFALAFIQDDLKVKLIGCSAEDIVDGNIKIILGMLWRLIQKFQLTDELNRQGLLNWCQNQTKGYDGVAIDNFHTSFKDGKAFCALIHKYDNSLLDYNAVSKESPTHCLAIAFDVGESNLDIPRLLEVEDVADGRADERSIMTYVSFLHGLFSDKLSGGQIRRFSQKLTASIIEKSKAEKSSGSLVGNAATLQEILSLQDQIDVLRKENQLLKDQVSSLTQQLAEAAKSTVQTSSTKTKESEELEALREEVARLKKSQSEQAEQKPKETKVEEVKKGEAHSNNIDEGALSELKNKLEDSTKENGSLKKELEEVKNKLHEAQKAVEEKTRELADASKEKENEKKDHKSEQNKKPEEAPKDDIKTEEKKVEKSAEAEELEKLRKELADVKATSPDAAALKTAQDEIKAKDEEIARLKSGKGKITRSSSRKKMAKLKDEQAEKSKQDLDILREDKDREIKRLKEQIEILKKPPRQGQDAKLEGKPLETQIALLKAERNNAEMVKALLAKELEEMKEDVQLLKKKYTKQEERTNKAAKKKQEKSVAKLQEDLDRERKTNEEELKNKDAEIERLKSQLQKAQKDRAQKAENTTAVGSALEADLELLSKDHAQLIKLVNMFEAEETFLIKNRRSKADFDEPEAD